MSRSAVLFSMLVLAGCAARQPAGPPPPPPFDPVGVYNFSTEVQGTQVPGTLTIRRGERGLVAIIGTAFTGETTVEQVTVDGRKVEMRGAVGDAGDMVMTLEFTDSDRFTGSWSAGGMGASVSGVRRPPGMQ